MLQAPPNMAKFISIEAAAGTGKTYILNLILATVRQFGHIAVATASTGIAAILLIGGTTAHSRFAIPINGLDEVEAIFIHAQDCECTCRNVGMNVGYPSRIAYLEI